MEIMTAERILLVLEQLGIATLGCGIGLGIEAKVWQVVIICSICLVGGIAIIQARYARIRELPSD